MRVISSRVRHWFIASRAFAAFFMEEMYHAACLRDFLHLHMMYDHQAVNLLIHVPQPYLWHIVQAHRRTPNWHRSLGRCKSASLFQSA